MFKNGYDSLWQIGIIFLIYALLYPIIGYTKKDMLVPEGCSDIKEKINKCMELRNYVIINEDKTNMTFKAKNTINRLTRMYEDKIVFTLSESNIQISGLRKDTLRIASVLETLLTNS